MLNCRSSSYTPKLFFMVHENEVHNIPSQLPTGDWRISRSFNCSEGFQPAHDISTTSTSTFLLHNNNSNSVRFESLPFFDVISKALRFLSEQKKFSCCVSTLNADFFLFFNCVYWQKLGGKTKEETNVWWGAGDSKVK